MANSQIIKAGIQSGTLTAGRAASVSMGATFMSAANSIAMVMYNAAAAEQAGQQVAQACVTKGCGVIIANIAG